MSTSIIQTLSKTVRAIPAGTEKAFVAFNSYSLANDSNSMMSQETSELGCRDRNVEGESPPSDEAAVGFPVEEVKGSAVR